MLRELVDITILEDFLGGLARAGNLRTSVYNSRGELIGASRQRGTGARAAPVLRQLPEKLDLVELLPAPDSAAELAFIDDGGIWTIVVPIHVNGNIAGYVGIGAFRDLDQDPKTIPAEHRELVQLLPHIDRVGDARPVETARWAARMLTDWCLSGARLDASAEDLSLLRDIGEMLSDQKDLQTLLDKIVTETARVMGLQYCSLRLFDPQTQALSVVAGYNVLETSSDEDTFLRSENPIDDAALNGELVYVEDATSDTRVRFAQEAHRLGVVSGLAAGMIHLGKPIGVLRVYADHKRRFQTRHRNLLRAVALQAATAVVTARLFEDRLRSIATQRQLASAGQVQARMVRIPPPRHPRLESALVFEPSSHVSGDFCDIFMLNDGRMAAAVGDVVGHGMAAALLMASARGALRAAARNCHDLSELITQLNEHICRETTSSEFVTLMLIAIDRDARQLSYVNAGHEPLLILRDDGIIREDQADLILGVEPGESYSVHQMPLYPHDFILLYTDGIVEAMDFKSDMFGRERLYTALRQYGTLPPDQTLRNIRWDVRRFAGLTEQSDDLSMVGLRIRC